MDEHQHDNAVLHNTQAQCDSQAGKALEMSRNHNREKAEIQLLVLDQSFGQSQVPKKCCSGASKQVMTIFKYEIMSRTFFFF